MAEVGARAAAASDRDAVVALVLALQEDAHPVLEPRAGAGHGRHDPTLAAPSFAAACVSMEKRLTAAAGTVQARPASAESRAGSMPSLAKALDHLASLSWPNTISASAGTDSQPLAWISASSWPAPQPA